jgi:MATE family multidrug resistance protein
MFLAALSVVTWRRPFANYHVLKGLRHISWPSIRQLFALGSPISLAMLMEYGLFSTAAILMGMISTSALAAHQVAMQVTAALFMVPLGIAMAATVRVGHAFGRKDPAAIRHAGLVAVLLGTALVTCLTAAIIVGRYAIAEAFFGTGPETEATVELTTTLLLVGATFFIADAIQTIVGGALRGVKDTRITLVLAIIGYWCVGFPTAWLLAFPGELGAIGVWIGLSTGTLLFAGLLSFRWHLKIRKLTPSA